MLVLYGDLYCCHLGTGVSLVNSIYHIVANIVNNIYMLKRFYCVSFRHV